MQYIQTNFGFNGNPTAERHLEGDTLKVTITNKDKQRTFEMPLIRIRIELYTLNHEIRQPLEK